MFSTRQQFSRWVAIFGVGALALTACAEPVPGRAVAQPGANSTQSAADPSTVARPSSSAPTTSSSSSSSESSSRSSASSASSSTSPPAENTQTPPEETTAPEDTGAAAPTGDETPPGTTLALTDPATLPVTFIDDTGNFTFSDFKVVQGSTDDWAKLDVEPGTTAGLAPWYISFTVTQVSGPANFEYSDFITEIDGVTDQGRDLEYSYGYGSSVGCESGYFKDGYSVGDSYTTCTVFQTDDRAKVVQLEFRGEYDGPYYDNPVVWTVG